MAVPRETAVLTPLDAYDGTTGTLGSATSVSTSASASPRNEATASGWQPLWHVLLASLVGVPVGLMAGEWSWRERPHTLAKKLEENKQAFLKMVKTPLSEKQLQNIGQIGGLASTYNELVAKYKNQDSLQLNLPNFSGDSSKLLTEIGTLLKEKELEALKLYELEQLLEVDETKLQAGQVIAEDVMKNTVVVTEEAPRGFLTWLRKSEKDLRNIEIAGHLAKAAGQSKLIAATVAGGVIGAGVVLLNLWHRHSVKKEQELVLMQQQQALKFTAAPKKVKPLKTESAISSSQDEAKPSTETPAKPETVQAFWEKQRKH